MKTYQRCILVFFLVLLMLPQITQAGVEQNVKKSFKVNPGGLLNLVTDLGSIEVRTTGDNSVEVEVIFKVREHSHEDIEELLKDFDLLFDQRGNDVFIHGEFKRKHTGFWDREWSHLNVQYLISVPRKYNVDLNTSGGSISVDDLEGDVRSKTSGGNLSFGNISGPVWGRTSGGSITLAGCKGSADVNTSGGSIRIGEVDGNVEAHTSGGSISIERAKGRVSAETSGGSINVEEVMGEIEATTSGGSVTANISKQPQNNCYLETSGGSVKVHLAAAIAVDVDASTSSGYVETDFPVTIQGKINKSSLQAKINGGGPTLTLRTSGGNIYLHKMSGE